MEKNSLWKNIRNKAKENIRTGDTPKKPTAEMLRQEREIKANSKMMGGIMSPTISTKGGGLGTAIAAGGLALAASKLFGGKGDVMPDVGKMKYGGKMKNC
jgi:hypothetical protein